jgi:hypothetical protein
LDGAELQHDFRTTIAFAQQLAPPIKATDAGVVSHRAVGRIVIRRSPTMKEAGYAGACHRAARCADPLGYNPPYALRLPGRRCRNDLKAQIKR